MGGLSLAEHCANAQDGNTSIRYRNVQWENYQKINVIGICWAFGSA
jgi:hypothetical protein